jgi:hypothetical protein
MHDPLFQGDRQRALAISRYVQALATGDLEAVARIVDEALQDEALERLVVAVNIGYDERWQRLASHLAEDVASGQPIKRPLATPHESHTERSLSRQRTFRSAVLTRTNRFAQVAATVVAVLLVGSLLLVLHLAQTSQRTQTGANTPAIHTGTLLCSISYPTGSRLFFGQPPLDWSAHGVIITAYPVHTFAAQTCASQSLVNVPATSLIRPAWSPDGQRLLLLAGDTATVLDARTGQTVASFHARGSPAQFDGGAWTPDGKQIITSERVILLPHAPFREIVQVWDASTGAFIRTPLTFDHVLGGSLAPDASDYAVQTSEHMVEIWKIDSGKLVSSIASSVAGPVAWSPGDALLALGLSSSHWPAQPGEVQLWSTATGQLLASFQDSDTFEGMIGGLAWSPDGKYLAESSAQIHIWDVTTRKLVATFGQITTKTTANSGKTTMFSEIVSVAWAVLAT